MNEPITLDFSQQAAVDMATAPGGGICIITGGPGVGKTTTLGRCIDVWSRRGLSIALVAPTGKAARRMQEATGREASTIHRLLGWQNSAFYYNARNPLPHDVLVGDESSMLDVVLCDHLLSAVKTGAKVVLVGDDDQLPPVGPGSPFGDLIKSGRVQVARLKVLHRAAQMSWVCTQAPRIIAGEMPDLAWSNGGFRLVEVDSTEGIVPALCELASAGGEFPQVLIPISKWGSGTHAANDALREVLNPDYPDKLKIRSGGRLWRVGDRVINTRNNYDCWVMNGETGTIIGPARDEDGRPTEGVEVDFGDRFVSMPADDLQLSYALTGHRFQGSEARRVAVVVTRAHTYSLTRRWLYTAVTRAREEVILVGDVATIERTVRNGRDDRRNSTLIERMTDAEKEIAAAVASLVRASK